ncbi:sigma-54 interaction domain-containing protein [Thermoflavimicrobium dichotomicum]|uniref:HTH-type transcriptional regulatory protein TyrR n=1 Tax=Thermoflavimicrobium dichotomicum TaxID=46223 RepID=A0A1I3PRJ2_9BACL|nr:sigma 54-interacting transcriptional regulator [Thermoflavimicrobium dichotomicum]SFJ23957.1 PAS domain S-box-containing protein/TyrR family helix-turn-helix domain-containing protein [Thermoflavimicrobium dichotomicum]
MFDLVEILDAIPNDIVITDDNGMIVYANKAIEMVYSIPPQDLIGKSVYDLEKQKIFSPSITRKVIEEKKKQTLIQETKLGTKVLVVANPVFDDQQNIKWVVSFSYDVTELFHLKEYAQKLEEEIKEVKMELDELKRHHIQDGVIVAHDNMKKVLQTAKKMAQYDVNILLTGQSGVGKSLIARYIHQHSKRSQKPLVEINCGSIPEALLESELFGYEPGSFSGAKQQGKKGLIEEAEGGTLFLDEIGELPINLQVKLLTLIQEKKFYRVGGTKPRQVDFRLITATNVNLEEKVKEGKFRHDLYFRLAVVPIHIPSLRERPQDIFLMIQEFTQRFNAMYQVKKKFHPLAIEKMLQYNWPGNVRELENMVERLILTVEEPVIEVHHLPEAISGINTLMSVKGKTLPEMVEEFEKEMIKQAYAKCKTTIELAKHLGISQPTAVRKLKKYLIRENDKT